MFVGERRGERKWAPRLRGPSAATVRPRRRRLARGAATLSGASEQLRRSGLPAAGRGAAGSCGGPHLTAGYGPGERGDCKPGAGDCTIEQGDCGDALAPGPWSRRP